MDKISVILFLLITLQARKIEGKVILLFKLA